MASRGSPFDPEHERDPFAFESSALSVEADARAGRRR
jgi:hypothetical protein